MYHNLKSILYTNVYRKINAIAHAAYASNIRIYYDITISLLHQLTTLKSSALKKIEDWLVVDEQAVRNLK